MSQSISMKPFSHSRILPFLALSSLPLVSALPVSAQTARSIYLYNSSFGQGVGVVQDARVGSLGNGTSTPARRVEYEDAPSLQVTTRSFAEGLRFELAQPVDPTPYMNNGFIRLRLKFREIGGGGGGGRGGFPGGGDFRGGGGGGGADPRQRISTKGGNEPDIFNVSSPSSLSTGWASSAQFRQRGGGALPGFGGAPRRGADPDPRGRGGDPRGMGDGGEGGEVSTGPLPQTTYIKELKVTLLRDSGAMTGRISVDLNSDDNQPDDDGWRLYTLAVKDMTSTPGASGPIRRVLLTSDTQDTFYMAQMALVVETGQMTVSIRTPDKPAGSQIAEIEWKPDRPLTLVADVEAGAADPQVEWNFDASNVGNLPLPAINGGLQNGDGTQGTEGDPRGGDGRDRQGGRDPRMGGGDPRQGATTGRGNIRGQLGIGGGGNGAANRFPGVNGEGGDGGEPAFIGPRIDARGLTAKFSYPNEEQDYRVEVTVRDRSGQKQPVTASIIVRIRG